MTEPAKSSVVPLFPDKSDYHPDLTILTDPADPLKKGGGGGTFDGMEERVKHLEMDVSELKADMKAVRTDIAYIRGKLDTMPTTMQLIGFAIAIFVAAGVTNFFR